MACELVFSRGLNWNFWSLAVQEVIVKSEGLGEVLFQLATSVKSSIFKDMLEACPTAFYVEVLFTFFE